jgi:hypothetical protein
VSGVLGPRGAGQRGAGLRLPPPYLEVAGPYRRFLENAVSIRGPGWMDLVLRSHGPLERFLFGEVGEEAAARRLGDIVMVLRS